MRGEFQVPSFRVQETLSTESAARSASDRAVVTFGPRCSELLSRSELLSWLRSDCQVSSERKPETGLRPVSWIVLHCSATKLSQSYPYERLARDHKKRGFGEWPGYHFYVTKDGTLYYCRPIGVKGCHVKGHNEGTVGVCYEGGLRDVQVAGSKFQVSGSKVQGSGSKVQGSGFKAPSGLRPESPYEDTRTAEQMITLHWLLVTLHEIWPLAKICGHRDFSPDKNGNGVIDPWEYIKACPCFDARHEYAYIFGT